MNLQVTLPGLAQYTFTPNKLCAQVDDARHYAAEFTLGQLQSLSANAFDPRAPLFSFYLIVSWISTSHQILKKLNQTLISRTV